ncbi:MAG: BREX-1 system adenine-specific DNA-methyltransferase PglX, partial [Candidatus Omnitrophica bacterium]|nr:BREX-1 system adenine-specific DNA-methyltransferase PglX [Candidatus Omnitrophota bacterium]
IYEKLNAIRPDNFDKYVEVLKSGKKGEETKFNKEYAVYYTPREIVHYMCQESLINYLETELKGKVSREDLEKFMKIADSLQEFEAVALEREEKIKSGEQKTTRYESQVPESIKQNAEDIDKLLADIKVCDPAVGSGAFPIGMMHEIVKLRQLLSVYIGRKTNTYDLKRHCIENSLYGVDIDLGAVEICKLRFWLSLIVDEEDFYNIRPLPNLDYKVVCGDSLLGYPYEPHGLEEVEKLKKEYFSETNPIKKQNLKQKIDSKIAKQFENSEKALGYKVSMDFQFNFSEVFHQKGGFDIVIENPPYVRQERIKNYKPLLQKANYEVFNSTSDLYTYFYEKSLKIAKQNGFICMITSNKWMRARYGEKLRNLLKNKTTLKQIIDFNGYPVFEAKVDTNIILFQKKEPTNDTLFKAITIGQDFDIQNISEYIQKKAILMEQAKLQKEVIILAEDRILKLKEKIEKIGKPLKDWNVKIYFGIKTGFNEAFIIDSKKREEILRNCRDKDERKRTEEIIKPILRGKDIGRYYYRWAGLWVIKIESGWTNKNRRGKNPEQFFRSQFPAVYDHLISFINFRGKGKGLINRDDQGDYWWELRECAYYPEFEKEKIVWQEIVREPSFAYDTTKIYCEATTFLMTGSNLKYLLAILNSKPATFFFKHFYAGGGLGEEGYRYKKAFLEQLPIPKISEAEQKPFINLVDKILAITKDEDYLDNPQKQAKVKKLEKEIDQLVYKLYDLTEDEIKIIESNY